MEKIDGGTRRQLQLELQLDPPPPVFSEVLIIGGLKSKFTEVLIIEDFKQDYSLDAVCCGGGCLSPRSRTFLNQKLSGFQRRNA
jgi:hypothetical protein